MPAGCNEEQEAQILNPGMTTYLPKWISNGFLSSTTTRLPNGKLSYGTGTSSKIKNADMIKHLLVLLRRRGGKKGVRFKYVPGHVGVEGNEGADVSVEMLLFLRSLLHPALHPSCSPSPTASNSSLPLHRQLLKLLPSA